jgi:ribonuclease HII
MPKRREDRERHASLLVHERELWAKQAVIAGLDEVGAGTWAGPVTAGCVVLDPDRLEALIGVDDSKKLTKRDRASFAEQIRQHAVAWAVAEASVEEIDRGDILLASMLAMERALAAVREKIKVTHLLVDAHSLSVSLPQRALPKGDASSLSIAAASILAKVDRDAKMTALAAHYPNHGFEHHMGYGTAEHRRAIETHGITPEHRRSFAPVRALLPDTSPPSPQLALFR